MFVCLPILFQETGPPGQPAIEAFPSAAGLHIPIGIGGEEDRQLRDLLVFALARIHEYTE